MPTVSVRERFVIHTGQFCEATGQEWVFDSRSDEWCPTNCVGCDLWAQDQDDPESDVCICENKLNVSKEPE